MIRPGPNSLAHLAQRKVTADDEHQQQAALVLWSQRDAVLAAYPELAALYAVPNYAGGFGASARKHGARLKREGRKRGVPDVVLPVPRGGFAALYVEMKSARGALSPEQRAWRDLLASLGNKVEVHRTWESARDAILAYLALPRTVPTDA
jgi:hypothetical protein